MNKEQLVTNIAHAAEITMAEAEQALAATLDSIKKSLKKRDTVTFVGFGSFGVKKRAERKVRNPRTGEEMIVKATSVPYFKAGKNLKEIVDTNKN
jgi:DNA-binding protein HU-beta